MGDYTRDPSSLPGLGRRRFLRAVGLAVAAPLVTTLAARAELGVTWPTVLSRPLRLGVLLPSSPNYPQMAENLLAGLTLGAEREGRELALVREDLGAEPGAALSAARRLIEESQVEGLLGVIHAEIAARLAPILAEKRVPLWVCEAGASVASVVSPWITYHTLHYWQAQWLLGDWAARNLGKRAAIAASLYDSGYDAFYAFRLGFEGAGGEIVQTHVTHIDPQEDGLGNALTDIANARPDFVYGLYSGQAGHDFVASYVQAGLAAKLPLAASAFVADDVRLAEYGSSRLQMIRCLPWSRDADNPEQITLDRAFGERTGRKADLFAALGYDAGRLIVQTGGKGAAALSRLALASPRGRVTVDGATRQTHAPLYVQETRVAGGLVQNTTVATLALPTDLDRRWAAARSGPATGWLNTYLSV